MVMMMDNEMLDSAAKAYRETIGWYQDRKRNCHEDFKAGARWAEERILSEMSAALNDGLMLDDAEYETSQAALRSLIRELYARMGGMRARPLAATAKGGRP